MTRRRALKIALVILIAGIVVGIYFSPLRQHLNRNDIRAAVEQFRGLWYGPLIFIAAYAISCVFALPASVFIVAAGFIWGWKLGGAYALLGGLIGGTASFFVARFVGEGLLTRFGRVGQAVRKQVDHAGFKSLLLLRFVPGLPFAAVNYGAGVAGVKVPDFLAATVIGLIPPNFVFAYCADALFNGTMTEGDAFKRLAIVCALMIALVLIPTLIKRFKRPQASGLGPQKVGESEARGLRPEA
ncbi:MAG TPA: TVP38/TMEM64 family protein [Thermoanaerobaculia bacterium]|nr:TVP38/TMEM64 family protein [Thermoanaerobaculia bacterium]